MSTSSSHIRSMIKEELERLSYVSKEQGYSYGVDHDKKDKNYDDIIGHT